jgi:hypothetical protein
MPNWAVFAGGISQLSINHQHDTPASGAAIQTGLSCGRRLEDVRLCVHMEGKMPAIKVGVREFREQIARFLESDTPVAVTRRGETLGVYVPTPRKRIKSADIGDLKAAADRLALTLADVDEEEIVADFKQLRRRKNAAG